ncbi:MAG: tetraacyldisaccharide 4'-kinase, partial [Planctomycetota bacterium]
RGLLREPLESLKRADLVVINRINLVPIETVEKIRERIAEFTEFRRIGTSEIIPQNWLQFSGRRFELDHLTGKRILMVCGIGNPDNFRQTLIQIGLDVIQQKIFPDHHAFSRDDMNDLGKLAKSSTVDAIVCTHKDLVKIGVDIVAELPVYALLITVEMNEGKELLDQLINEACEKISSMKLRSTADPTFKR